MRVFITGGAGYIGRAVTRELVSAGHVVTGLARSSVQKDLIHSLGAAVVSGDLGDAASYASDAASADAVVHLAARSDDEGRARLETLLELARRGAVRHFVYTSVLFVLGNTGDGADEETPVSSATYVLRSACERDVLAAQNDRLTCAVVRPGMVYGGGNGGSISELFRGGLAGSVRYVGTGENRWSLVHRDDVASLYRLVLERKASGVFHATDGVPLSVREVAMRAAEVSATGASLESVPIAEARMLLGEFADALCLDQPVRAPHSHSIGWAPAWPSFTESAAAAMREFRSETERS